MFPFALPRRDRLRLVRSNYVDLAYAAGRLSWPFGSTRAAAGRSGVRVDKAEGDGATPAGTFSLLGGMYRPDRLAAPRTGLRMTALQPRHAWVDDPADPDYNRLVSLPHAAHAEALWRDDDLYDVLVIIGYNIDPTVAGAGSAIFLHVARPDFSGTEGCVAVAKDVLVGLLALIGPGSTITVNP